MNNTLRKEGIRRPKSPRRKRINTNREKQSKWRKIQVDRRKETEGTREKFGSKNHGEHP
jgi:hypothetical protein